MTTRRQTSSYKIGRRKVQNTSAAPAASVNTAWTKDDAFILVGSKQGLATDIEHVIRKIIAEQKAR